jgi:DNA-binding winged helix-turn-helix (wHTH) protein
MLARVAECVIPKSGYRFSEKITHQQKVRDPEKWAPVFGKITHKQKLRDPEKWASID